MSSSVTRQFLHLQGYLLIVLGLLAVAVAIHADSQAPDHIGVVHTLLLLLQTIGIATFGLGLFGIIVESKNWRDYFGTRLREIVVEQSICVAVGVTTMATVPAIQRRSRVVEQQFSSIWRSECRTGTERNRLDDFHVGELQYRDGIVKRIGDVNEFLMRVYCHGRRPSTDGFS